MLYCTDSITHIGSKKQKKISAGVDAYDSTQKRSTTYEDLRKGVTFSLFFSSPLTPLETGISRTASWNWKCSVLRRAQAVQAIVAECHAGFAPLHRSFASRSSIRAIINNWFFCSAVKTDPGTVIRSALHSLQNFPPRRHIHFSLRQNLSSSISSSFKKIGTLYTYLAYFFHLCQ